jgi:WD40 repeat protein
MRELLTLRGHTSGVETLSFMADGSKLLSISRDEVKVWDARPMPPS